MIQNTETEILQRLASQRGGLSIPALASALRFNSPYVTIISASLARRGLISLRGRTLFLLDKGRQALAHAPSREDSPRRRRTPGPGWASPPSAAAPHRRRAQQRPPSRRRVNAPMAAERSPGHQSSAALRARPSRTPLEQLRSAWKILTTPIGARVPRA